MANIKFKPLGTSTEVEECHCCGRTNLKKTVKLGVLDEEGNIEDVVYYGTTCAARATGWNKQWMRDELSKADEKRYNNEHSAKCYTQLRDAIVQANCNPVKLPIPMRGRFHTLRNQIANQNLNVLEQTVELKNWLDNRIQELLAY